MENEKVKILAIDDNFDNLITIQALILEFFINADVILATSGKEGIELAECSNPDVILLDILMPEMDGFEVCKKLKSDKHLREIPIVFVTALKGDKESRIRGLEVGGDAFLAKPIDESELIAQLRAMIKIKKANFKRRDENERLAALIEDRTSELNRTHIATMNLLEDLRNENEARKNTEIALRASEEKYRELANLLPQSVFELDADRKVTYVNEQTYKLLGYSRTDNLVGRNSLEFHVPEERERAQKNYYKAIDGSLGGGNEYQMVRKDGTTFPALIYLNHSFENGNIVSSRGILVDITNQKKAELQVRESEQKYRLITEKITDVVWLLDLNGKSLFVSKSIEKFTGYTVDEYLNQTINDRFTKESAEKAHKLLHDEVEEFYSKSLNPNEIKKTMVLEYLCKDGSTKFGELLISPYLDESNHLIGIHGVTRDISKRTRAEKKLQESEEKFREMAEMLPQIIFETDKNGIVTYVNKQAYNLLGFNKDKDELIGLSSTEFYFPKDRAMVLDNVNNRLNNLNTGNNVYRMLKKDGSVFPALIYSNPIVREGESVGLRGIIVDISEQIHAEKVIKESEALYRAILEASPDYVIITDIDGHILMVSPSAVQKYGYTNMNEIIGADISKFIYSADARRMSADFSKLQQGIQTGPNEYKSCASDGSIYDIEVKGGIINDIDGKIVKLVFIARDITERKQTQEALERSEAKYRDFVENSPEAIAIYSEGVVTYVNQECLRLMRATTKEQLIGLSVIEFIHPDNREIVMNRMKDVAQLEMNTTLPIVEEKYIRLDGTEIYVEVKVMALMVDGKPSVQLTARDITERKIIREALEESENRYNTFINNNPDMIFVKDDQFRYLIANDAMAKFYGKKRKDIIGKTDQELAINNDLFPCISSDKRAINAGSAFVIEEKLGDKIYETIKFPMQLKDNKKGVGGILRDITNRKQIEDALERSRTELKTIYDNAPVMMCLVDEERNILFSNNAFTELVQHLEFDLKSDKLGNVIGCVNSGEKSEGCGFGNQCSNCKLRLAITNTFETGEEHRNIDFNYKIRKSDKIFEYSLLGSTAIIENAGKQNLLLCLSDITDRKLTEEALQKSEMILRTFIDNVPFEIWARDNNQVGILENSKMVEHFGSIIDKKPYQQLAGQNGLTNLNFSRFNRVFKGEIVDEEFECFIDNQRKIFQQIIFPIFNKTVVNGIAGINIDITDRKAFEAALNESQLQLKKFAAHLQNVREEEKVLLAREIHDELGQMLIALKIDMGMLKQRVLKNVDEMRMESVTTGFNNIFSLIDTTIKTARKIMTDLRPEVLELLGFSEAIKFHAKTFQERFKVKCTFKNSIKNLELDDQQSVALFRIIQEALNNVAKHSKATIVKINLHAENDKFLLEINDNGVGFDSRNSAKKESYGLIGMKERVFLLDGELSISSEINKGTTIRIEMPYKG